MTSEVNRSGEEGLDATNSVETRVRQLIAAHTGRESVAPDAALVADLKFNAITFTKLLDGCEQEFELEIPDDEADYMKEVVETVGELTEVLEHKLRPTGRLPAVLQKTRRRGPKFGKNIIICCDGTGNEYGDRNTNVVRTFQALVRDKDQIAFYDPGIGTFNALGKTFGRKVGKVLGSGFGYGLRQNIEDAYVYLMDRFHPGDQVYLFGFSRGAFTVRSLAGLLFKCGLLQKGSKNLIPYVLKVYNQRGNDDIAEGFKDTYCHECKPHLIGVWDTVKSLGHVLGKKFFDQTLNPHVTFGYQAASIDEKRKKFPISLWDEAKEQPNQTIEQVWFAGVHSDVGGSYKERGLSDTALVWMLRKAEAAGLRLRKDWKGKTKTQPAPTDKNSQHESRRGLWKLWFRVHREIASGALIHESVFQRKNAGIGYNPPNLPKEYRIVGDEDDDRPVTEV